MNSLRPLFLTLAMALSAPVGAEELSELSPVNASYCAFYSRQMVFIDAMHGDQLVADSDVIRNAALDHYVKCVSILPTLLPLPPAAAGFDQWVSDIRDLVFMRAKEGASTLGTEPASASPSDEEWRQQCRAEYVSWDEETGTVVRRGSPERVKCPLIKEGDQWVIQ